MNPAELLDEIQRTADSSAARRLIREHAGLSGLSLAFFQRVVSLMGSSPDQALALAGRWRLFREFGDDPALALRAKGGLERMQGKWARSIESFLEAGRLAKTPIDRLANQVGAVESLGRLGRVDEAVTLGTKLASGLRRLKARGLAGRVRLNTAAALLWVDRYGDAERWLRRALKEFEAEELEHEAALARMSLSTCRLHAGDPDAARAMAEDAAASFRRDGAEHLANLCESNVAQALLQLGRADEAFDVLLKLKNSYAEASQDAARVEEFHGDAYFRLNMPEQARSAYEAALAHPAQRALSINRANSLLGLSWAELSIGNWRSAVAHARRAGAAYQSFGNSVWSAAARLAEADALAAGGREREAQPIAEIAVVELRRENARFLLAEALLLLASLKITQAGSARAELRQAASLIRQRGMDALEWRLQELRALQDPRRALVHYRRMLDAILRVRLQLTSTMARSSYLRDKSNALSGYLARLLGRPTPASVAEALYVIRSTRAVALVDEVLSSAGGTLSPRAAEELEALRQELSEAHEAPPSPGSNLRRRGTNLTPMATLARRWGEWTHDLSASIASRPSTSDDAGSRVLGVAGDRTYLISGSRSFDLGSSAGFRERMRWLWFELLAPMADRQHGASVVQQMLEAWHDEYAELWPGVDGPVRIAPDGDLWGVPWAAIASAKGRRIEPVLSLGPDFGAGAASATLDPQASVVLVGGPRTDLPQIERELESAGEHFPRACLLRTAREFREFLHGGQADLLHVACHAKLDPSFPMFSYLEFEDGKIYAIEISRSAMRCRLATLSACDTGSLALLNRSEPEGLVRAFLARGAKGVLASMWALDDEAAFHFSKMYNLNLKRGLPVGEAIQSARSEVRENFPHPYFWAPMVLYGGYMQ